MPTSYHIWNVTESEVVNFTHNFWLANYERISRWVIFGKSVIGVPFGFKICQTKAKLKYCDDFMGVNFGCSLLLFCVLTYEKDEINFFINKIQKNYLNFRYKKAKNLGRLSNVKQVVMLKSNTENISTKCRATY